MRSFLSQIRLYLTLVEAQVAIKPQSSNTKHLMFNTYHKTAQTQRKAWNRNPLEENALNHPSSFYYEQLN